MRKNPELIQIRLLLIVLPSPTQKLASKNREKAVEDNVIFAGAISKFCKRRGLRCYYLSTETVFGKNGSFKLPTENDIPFPQTWYGATKRLGELASADFGARIIRLPLLVDIDDPETVFGKLINRLKSGFRLNAQRFATRLLLRIPRQLKEF